jgi:hypothetical protein
MAEGPSEEEYDWSDYVSSDSDAGADPYRDDPQWTDQCANACDVVGSLGRFAFSFSNCFVFSITCFSNFFGGVADRCICEIICSNIFISVLCFKYRNLP